MPRLLLLLGLLLATGCSLTYPVHAPRMSGVHYEGSAPAQALQLSDARKQPMKFSDGRVRIHLEFDQGGDEIGYLQQHVAAELMARGVPTTVKPGPQALEGHVRDFGMRNRRVSGFSPMVTFTRFSADFRQGPQTVRIAAYTKQSKTPMWSMSELEEPCINRPLHLVIGEVAAKLNRHFVGARASVASVQELAERAPSAQGEELLQITNALGWSNQPAALAPLLELTRHAQEEVRGAALGSLGTLGEAASLPHLTEAFRSGRSHTDRFMALKAIGDLGTPEALGYLRQVAASEHDDHDAVREITALYLDGLPVPSAAVAPVASR